MACILDELKKELVNRITETKSSKSYKSKDKTALSKVSSLANLFNEVQKLEKQVIKEDSTTPNQVNTKSGTPVLDTLPSYTKGQNNKTYAGIGSRETPPEVLQIMTKAAKWLEQKGYHLQTGKTFFNKEEGADKAFSDGTKSKTLFAPESIKIDSKEWEVAKELHPNFNALTKNWNGDKSSNKGLGGAKLMARNTNQVFGKNLDKPVDFILFYAEETSNPLRPKGGTGQAVEMARRKGIPTINMADKDWRSQLTQALKDAKSNRNKPTVEVLEHYTIEYVRSNKNKIFVFGDNNLRKGFKGQAVIRNEDNVFGIRTKYKPSTTEDAYFTDSKFESNKHLIDSDIERIVSRNMPIVLPKNGIGTGLAKLSEKAPKTYNYLVSKLNELAGFEYMKPVSIENKSTVKVTPINAIKSGKIEGIGTLGYSSNPFGSQISKGEKDFTWIEDLVESGVLPNTMSLVYRKKIAKGLMQFGASRKQASIIVKSFASNPEYLKRGVIALQKDSTNFSDNIDTLEKYLNEELSRRDFDRKIEDFINQLEKGPTLLGVKSDQYIDTQRASLYPNISFEKMPELIRSFLREGMVTEDNENNLWMDINSERVETEAEALKVMFPNQDINALKKELQVKLDSNEINGC